MHLLEIQKYHAGINLYFFLHGEDSLSQIQRVPKSSVLSLQQFQLAPQCFDVRGNCF
jgi:hypothetical protein